MTVCWKMVAGECLLRPRLSCLKCLAANDEKSEGATDPTWMLYASFTLEQRLNDARKQIGRAHV